MENFISFIFIAIFTVWLIGWLGRLLLRLWLRNKQRQFAEQFGGAQQQAGNNRRGRGREGDVSVQQTAHVEKKVNKSVGDYVEFEEVEIIEETKEAE